MFANTETAICMIVVSAVWMMAPSDYWSLGYLCSDFALFCGAVLSYWLLFELLSRCRRRSCSVSGKECAVEDDVDAAESSSCDYDLYPQSAVESLPEQKQEPEFDVSEHVALMEKYASGRNLGGAMRTFRLIQKSDECLNSHMYNIVLQACINCGNVLAAEDWMEEIMEAKMADRTSFNILIKALVRAHALSKAKELLKSMRHAGIQPCIITFNELLSGLVDEGRFSESLSMLDEMHRRGVAASSATRSIITKLINESRNGGHSADRIRKVLCKFDMQAKNDASGIDSCTSLSVPMPVAVPRLESVLSQVQEDDHMPAPCAHEIQVTGSLAHVKAARRTLKQHGFLDKAETDASPLDGHWETERGLTVVIEGKIVRWSAHRASKLRFTKDDRSACVLTLYGEAAQGQLMSPPLAPDASKTLMWSNGDVWHSYDGRVIGQDTLFSQSMTKTIRDKMQDQAYRARSYSILKCVSKQGLGGPAGLEESIVQFLGNDLYHISLRFVSKWNPSNTDDDDELPLFEAGTDICETISRRHPNVGLHHCWAEPRKDCCAQRTLVHGQQVDEHAFNRHIGAVCWA